MRTPNDHVLSATDWAALAGRDLGDVVGMISAVGRHVARDIERGDTDFIMAKQQTDAAWDALTGKVLKHIARCREALNAAEEAAIEQARGDGE